MLTSVGSTELFFPKDLNQEALIVVEDDQQFLTKHKELVDKELSKDARKGGSSILNSLQKLGGMLGPTTGTDTSAPGEGILEKEVNSPALSDEPPSTASPSLPNPAPPPTTSPVLSSSTPASVVLSSMLSTSASSSTTSNEHQVLADFFNNLINKDRRKPSASATTPANTSTSKLPLPGATTTSSREDVEKQLDKLRNKKV